MKVKISIWNCFFVRAGRANEPLCFCGDFVGVMGQYGGKLKMDPFWKTLSHSRTQSGGQTLLRLFVGSSNNQSKKMFPPVTDHRVYLRNIKVLCNNPTRALIFFGILIHVEKTNSCQLCWGWMAVLSIFIPYLQQSLVVVVFCLLFWKIF